MMAILTIVIPVYNVEKYLSFCIQSIINQEEFKKCEILLIDDGSEDDSSKICDDYASKYENIVALHKTNGGLSDARNYGLKRAGGDYVFFFDSDDYLEKKSLQEIFDIIENKSVDILMFDASCVDEQGKLITKPKFEFIHTGLFEEMEYTGEQALKSQLIVGGMQTTVWLALYRREFLIREELWFEKGLLHEDELWTPIVVSKAKRVSYIGKQLYCYRLRENSIMRDKNKNHNRNVECYIYIYNFLIHFYENNIDDEELKKYLMNDLCSRYLFVIKQWKFFKYPTLASQINSEAILKYSVSLKNILRAVWVYIYKKIFYK